MKAHYAASLGIAAAVVGTLAEASAQAAEELTPEPNARPAGDLVPDLRASDPLGSQLPAPDLLARELSATATLLKAPGPAKDCDDKCKVVVLTEAALPNSGAGDLVSMVLEPEKHGLSIPKSDGTPVVTFQIRPTKIARGEGLVATAKF